MQTEHFLQEIPLFEALDQGLRCRLAHDAHIRHGQRGQILFRQGDAVSGFYYIVTGSVKLSMNAPNGGEKVLEIIREGMTFCEAVVFIQQPYPVTAELLSDSTLLYIPSETILALIRQDGSFALKMISGLSRRLHFLLKDLESICLLSATQRVVGFLLLECHAPSGFAKQGHLRFPASKKIIAARLNLTPETLSRVLRRLQDEGLLSMRGQIVSIHDFEKLRNFGQCDE